MTKGVRNDTKASRRGVPSWVGKLKVRTIDPDRHADVAIASIPLPKDDHALVAFDGMASQAVPIAWYPPSTDLTRASRGNCW